MGINKTTRLFFLCLIYVLFINADCRKTFDCARTVYNFEIGVKAIPDSDSIHVNDTIWFEMNTPDKMNDLNTNELIEYSGVENLGSVITFDKLKDGAFGTKALNNFKLLLKQGQLVRNTQDPESFNEYLFSNENGYYQFKLGVIPLDTGIFRIFFSNAANVFRSSDKCTKASFEINFEQTNQHYNYYPNYQGDPFQKSGTYYFKVIQ